MASTYSTLKIQLMATGENSGTWGTVTNTNLGTAIEEAIVGSADVTFASNNQTLTLTDTNATQVARNLRLNLGGTTGGVARTLTVPAIEKVYIINNGCADTITVQNATGTGIAVPAGKTIWVYNNGVNVVDVVTHLTSLTLASALPIASGGTGSTTATFSGANITSINANNVSTGVLATAQGGTALSTFTAANNAIYSTSASALAAGTLPITAGGTGSTTATFSGANITSINANNISSGLLAIARGGTGAATLAGAGIPELSADQTFTGSQRGAIVTDNDLSFDMNASNNFACTPTAGAALTFTNITAGQSGFILLVNNSNYAITAASTTKVTSTTLSIISGTGTYLLTYFSNGTNVYVVNSGALA